MTPEVKIAWQEIKPAMDRFRRSGVWSGNMDKVQHLSILMGMGPVDVTCNNCIRSRVEKLADRYDKIKEEL